MVEGQMAGKCCTIHRARGRSEDLGLGVGREGQWRQQEETLAIQNEEVGFPHDTDMSSHLHMAGLVKANPTLVDLRAKKLTNNWSTSWIGTVLYQ
jgi:hypothetical protein